MEKGEFEFNVGRGESGREKENLVIANKRPIRTNEQSARTKLEKLKC